MPTSLASPNVENYTVGKGIVSVGGVDIGDVSAFEFIPQIDKLDRFISRGGVRQKTNSYVISSSAMLRMMMSEATAYNMALLLMADDSVSMDIELRKPVVAAVSFVATNDIGPKWDFDFPRVEFVAASIQPISDEWETLEIIGEVMSDVDGIFGTADGTFS